MSELYAIFLRKSRADIEAEARGEGETLARHEKILLDLARRMNLAVGEIYRELESGESLAARPTTQRLLHDVEAGLWAGVLTMEVERLARGDAIDQGIVSQVFKYSGTKIITPMKTYNPLDPSDQQYFEFGMFMSRQEYYAITRRMKTGRTAAAKEGKFPGGVAAYGYRTVPLERDRGFTLRIVPEEAEVVRLIYRLYVDGDYQEDGAKVRMGYYRIARRLDQMGFATPNGSPSWSQQTIRRILVNPVYAGKIRWAYRASVKVKRDGKIVTSCPINRSPIIVEGRHEAIIDLETWERAQQLISQRNHAVANRFELPVSNPLSGLVVCGKCGRILQKLTTPGDRPNVLRCINTHCDNKNIQIPRIEAAIIAELKILLDKTEWERSQQAQVAASALSVKTKEFTSLQKNLKTIRQQINSTHDLLERGIYDIDTFLARSRSLTERENNIEKQLDALKAEIDAENERERNQKNLIPKINNIIEVYPGITSPAEKNRLLKEVIDHVVIIKTTTGARYLDDFDMHLVPRAF